MPDRIRGHLLVLDSDSPLLKEGVNLPVVDARTYALIDDDEKVCRIISEDELEASFVDSNIATFQLQDVNWLTLDVDNNYVTLTYQSGLQTAVLLGSIDWNGGTLVQQYLKRNGIIYPIDASGSVQLDTVNTPNLVYIRTWYWKEAKRINDERLEIAEIVHAFSENIAGLGHASHFGH